MCYFPYYSPAPLYSCIPFFLIPCRENIRQRLVRHFYSLACGCRPGGYGRFVFSFLFLSLLGAACRLMPLYSITCTATDLFT